MIKSLKNRYYNPALATFKSQMLHYNLVTKYLTFLRQLKNSFNEQNMIAQEKHRDSGVKLDVVETIHDLYGLEDKWNQLLKGSSKHTVFQTWLWHVLWWKYFGVKYRLHIITVSQDNGPLIGIAPFFLYEDKVCGSTLAFIGGEDVTDYKDFIVATGWEQIFFTTLSSFLIDHSLKWDQLYLSHLPDTYHFLDLTRPVFNYMQIDKIQSEVCPFIELPTSWDAYLQRLDKKDRHELKRKLNKLEREVRYAMVITEHNDIEKAVNSFLRVHKLSSVDKSLFMDNKKAEFFLDVAKAFFKIHMFELPILYINGAVAASLFCFIYGDTVYIYNSGYDPSYSKWSPGIAIISFYIQKCIEKGRTSLDFLRGNESYKYGFGVQEKPLFTIRIWK